MSKCWLPGEIIPSYQNKKNKKLSQINYGKTTKITSHISHSFRSYENNYDRGTMCPPVLIGLREHLQNKIEERTTE